MFTVLCLPLPSPHAFGVYKPNDLYFEHYLKYRLHFELTVPLRTITGKKGSEHEKKIKYIKETKTSMINQKEVVKGKKRKFYPLQRILFPIKPCIKMV